MSSIINLHPCFKKWEYFDSIVFYSDPHFGDPQMAKLRGISDEEQIKNINKTCGKKSVFVCLGDVGDLECIKKIRGYKVLIKGNHDDRGNDYYQRYRVLDFDGPNFDNYLFDEVYDGPIYINKKILLSHEPDPDEKHALNIHGHCHDLSYKNDENHFNVCAEHIGYIPVRLNDLVKSGKLANIITLHRDTINKATERKKKRKVG